VDLRALQIFKAVVDEGGVARAAERLHCVQSNVSIRIRQLEDMLGTRLFERVGKRLTVTPRGMVLHSYAGRLLQLADEARQVVRGPGTPGAELRIGATATAAIQHLPGPLTDFHRSHPTVQLHVNVATTDSIVRDVLAQDLDIGIIIGAMSHPDLQQVEIDDDELTLVTNCGRRLLRSAKDLASTILIGFPEGCFYRDNLLRWMAEANIPVHRTLEFETTEAVVGCVAAGLGVTLMPSAIIENLGSKHRVKCHPFPGKYRRAQTMMIWRNDCQHQAKCRWLAESFLDRPVLPHAFHGQHGALLPVTP